MPRPSRPILVLFGLIGAALDPLVRRRCRDPVPPAQLPDVCSCLPRQRHELASCGHDRHLAPPHRSLPNSGCSGSSNVSTMSPATCPPCPRYVHDDQRPPAAGAAGPASPCQHPPPFHPAQNPPPPPPPPPGPLPPPLPPSPPKPPPPPLGQKPPHQNPPPPP